ncbi:MAG: hypothetical protein KBH09_10120 [Saprospiraceae bacterium]|nr:hypothetical protein [Saprospiraceae bacterium]
MKPSSFSPSPHYPFGMLTPGRNWSAESEYRFGFNGVENDSNIKGNGNHISTFWRQYDTRLARWMSPEPKSVAWESVYASFRNNPIYYSDPNGDWVKGAGFFRNLFNSDDKIDAENKAAKIGGDAQAYKNEEGGWNVSYTEGEMVDLGDGEMILKTLSIENFDKHSKSKNAQSSGGSWRDNVQTGLDVAGIADPTGVVDGVNALIYASRGQWSNAGISALAIIPYIGDLGKAERLGAKTLQLTSKARTAEKGLEIGGRFLGTGYKEIVPGVFRSSDGLRQFRMTDADILHSSPHFNFEIFSPNNFNKPIKNYHMPIR